MTPMHPAILKNPDWKNHQEAFPQLIELPTEWQGLAVQWEPGYRPTPVFIEQFSLPMGTDVYLFGVRFETAKASMKGRALPEGYFIEYLVLEFTAESPLSHRLRQNRGVVYSPTPTKKDYVPASNLGKREIERLCITAKPRWKSEDGQWPTCNGDPMMFVGQAALPENEVTRTLLTWDKALFLFWKDTDRGSLFKITTQDLDYQSIEEHYALE